MVPTKFDEQEDISHTNLHEITADLTDTVNEFREQEFKANEPEISFQTSNLVDQDQLVEKLKIALRPMIEEMVKEFCRESAEKVAWEVIPDLAENLIRKEIKEISDSLQH